MFCKYCGKDLGDSKKDICDDCLEKEKIETEEKVSTDDTNINSEAFKAEETKKEEPAKEPEIVDANSSSQSNSSNNRPQRSKLAAGLFGIFLGAFGVHNFYLGYEGKGVAQVLITVLSCFTLSFVSAIWGVVEGILILTGEINKDGYGNPLKDD